MPSELLTKIFSDNEHICKVRKENDPGWAKIDSNEKAKDLREVCDTNLVDHQRASIKDIQPRRKITPFLKVISLLKVKDATSQNH